MKTSFFISICIPSYNRPDELKRLLESIDTRRVSDVQIVICEDKSPRRMEVRDVVDFFSKQTSYEIKYVENHENCGHGKNLRECIKQADGEYIILMGDDDMFIPGAFDDYFDFVKTHNYCGYILRSWRQILDDGKIEYFRYFSQNKVFVPSIMTYTDLFLKSVFMSGFTIRRELVNDYNNDNLDDTLLYQLYLQAEVCMRFPSAYCNTPFVQCVGDGMSFFGTNEKEKGLYTPGILVSNNINFINGFFKVTNFVDKSNNIESTSIIKNELSKYSFHLMSPTRKLGLIKFMAHRRELKNIGLGDTIYFNIYFFSLLFFGEKICKNVILIIKKIIGRRLRL